MRSPAPGVMMLGWESDADHNRSVVTFAGAAEAVMEGAIRGAGKAAELIDLNAHQGVHPRVGAADVIPFVPLEDATIEQCVAIAHRAGDENLARFGVPVYFYEAAAMVPERSGWNESDGVDSTGGRRMLATSRCIPPRGRRSWARADF